MVMLQLNIVRPIAEEELGRAVPLASDADVAVVLIGTTEEAESEGFDRDSFVLTVRTAPSIGRCAGLPVSPPSTPTPARR
jgi:beta-glucosidase